MFIPDESKMNMNHCRFTKAFQNLKGCEKYIGGLSEEEEEARKKLVLLCVDIAVEYGWWYNKDIVEVEEEAIVLFEE